MKIYTHYSDSHKPLYENFKKTLRELYTKEEVLIRALYHPQTTKSGSFMTHGWLDSMDYKLNLILDALNENKDSWFIFSFGNNTNPFSLTSKLVFSNPLGLKLILFVG